MRLNYKNQLVIYPEDFFSADFLENLKKWLKHNESIGNPVPEAIVMPKLTHIFGIPIIESSEEQYTIKEDICKSD